MAFSDYNIEQVVYQGKKAAIYRAIDTRDSRLVALKVYAQKPGSQEVPTSASHDPSGVIHRNIVETYESGVSEDRQAYVAMEWCPNGDLGFRLAAGVTTAFIQNVTITIASAIDAIYKAGYSHGDVKPSNILFRANDEPVLIDLRSQSDTGTPGYRSPEFEKTGKPSRASDYYSLGVLLYRSVVGEMPWRTPSGDARSRTRTDYLTSLPTNFLGFSKVLDQMLAFDPSQRPTSAEQFKELMANTLPDQLLSPSFDRADLVSTEEILGVTRRGADSASNLSNERSGVSRLRWIAWPLSIGGGLFLAGATVYLLQAVSPPIAEQLARIGLAEHPRLGDAWQTAESLDADPNQSLSTVIAAYNAVLELSPEHEEAKTAINLARSRWKADISSAIDQGNLALARPKLADALAVYPNDPDFLALFDRISNQNRVEALLSNTRVLLDRSGIETERSAIMAIHNYLEVMRLDSNSEEARSGLDELATHFGRKAATSAERGKLSQAIEFLGKAVMASSALPYLEEVRQSIRKAETLRDEIAAMLQQAGNLRSAGHLIEPEGANAAELYHQVLSIDPENGIAAQGLSEISSRVVDLFETNLEERQFSKVDRMLARSVTVGLDQESIGLMQERYRYIMRQIQDAEALVQQAFGLMANGLITQPIERNAVSLLREALQLDPKHPQAEALLQECASLLVAVAEEAYAVGMKSEASLYLDLALTVQPDAEPWRAMRTRWLEEASSTLHRGSR